MHTDCLRLDALATHVSRIAAIPTTLELNARMAAVEADEQPDESPFVAGIRCDYDAVRNGLTVPHHSARSKDTSTIKKIK